MSILCNQIKLGVRDGEIARAWPRRFVGIVAHNKRKIADDSTVLIVSLMAYDRLWLSEKFLTEMAYGASRNIE